MKSALRHALIAFLISGTLASAATLGGVVGPALSGGNGSIPACDPDGLTAAYTTSAGNLTAFTIGGIADPGCEGASLSLTVIDATGTSIASAVPQTIPTDVGTIDNTLLLTVTPNPPAESPAGVEIIIAGP